MSSTAIQNEYQIGRSITAAAGRQDWLDRLKSVLTIMVVSVHAAATYGGVGGWFYHEFTTDVFSRTALTLMNGIFQSFFMSLFFFISGYFVPRSLERKGTWRFVGDRLLRLGVPCLAFFFVLGPLAHWITWNWLIEVPFSYEHATVLGPLWFAQALLIFTGFYLLYRALARRPDRGPDMKWVPSRGQGLLLFAILSVMTFLARWAMPMGQMFLGMQLGSFPHYITLFALGIVANQNGWLQRVAELRGQRILAVVLGLVAILLIVLPFGQHPRLGMAPFLGGFSWQAAFYAVWETGMCITVSLLALGFFQTRNRRHTRLSREFAASAYTIYIIHAVVLVALTVVMRDIDAHPLLKYVLLLVTGTGASFALAIPIRRLPGLTWIL